MPDPIFTNADLQRYYTKGYADELESALTTFRTGGAIDEDEAILAFDKRLASFEFVLFNALPPGKNSDDFPYDKVSMRREFLDELVALLLDRSVNGRTATNEYNFIAGSEGASALVYQAGSHSPSGSGINEVAVNKNAPVAEDPNYGSFANLTGSATHADVAFDRRRLLLNDAGRTIFFFYSRLIDDVFAEGEKRGDDPAVTVQNVSSTRPISLDGVTYDKVGQLTGVDADGEPTYQSYLLSSDAKSTRVTKTSAGDVGLEDTSSSTAKRLLIDPQLFTKGATAGDVTSYDINFDGYAIRATVNSKTGELRIAESSTLALSTATAISPLALNVPGEGNSFPELRMFATHRYTTGAPGNKTYLLGASSDGKLYLIPTDASRVSNIGTVGNLNALEYLLFYNEARIKVLRAKLSYNEAIVREIQEDLRQANEVLAQLELQAGAITAFDKDGQPTYQTSAETLRMSLFNATNSKAGDPIFSNVGADSVHGATEWEKNRTSLKNYIDRKSAEAQQATLDYQTVLNRFNNAFEVMGKLQEKLDTLLKAQLRNLN